MRIAFKPVTADTAKMQATSVKQNGAPFFDMLARISSDADQALNSAGNNSKELPNDDSDSHEQGQTSDSHSLVLQAESDEISQSTATTRVMSGSVNSNEVAQGSITAFTKPKTTACRPDHSVTPQPQLKTAQATGGQNTNLIASVTVQNPLQQSIVAQPVIVLAENAGNDSTGEQETSSSKSPWTGNALVGSEALKSGPRPVEQALGTGPHPVEQARGGTIPVIVVQTSDNLAGIPTNDSASELVVSSHGSAAATNTLAPGAPLAKSDLPSNSTNGANQSKSRGTAFTAASANAGSVGAPGAARSSRPQDPGSVQHATQNSGQTCDQAPARASETTQVPARPSDAIATPTTAFTTQVAIGESSKTHSASGEMSEAPTHAQGPGDLPPDQMERAGVGGSGGINTARLMQSIGESEMRLGMHSAEFGDISIRTSVTQQQVQAQINVDHGELSDAITAHIPSLQTKLGNDSGLHTSIEVNQLGGFHSGGQGHPSQQNQNWSPNRNAAVGFAPITETDSQTLPPPPLAVDESRLDIRA